MDGRDEDEVSVAAMNVDDELTEERQMASLNDLLRSTAKSLKQPVPPLDSSSSTAYLSRLANLPMPVLLAEPETLKASSSGLDVELGQLCFREYRTFILAHEASSAIETSFDKLDRSLQGLLGSTSSLEKASRAFAQRVEEVLEERRELDGVLENLGKVEELLEVPRLVGTCVRVGNWNEAVELWSRVRELERRTRAAGQGEKVARAVREEVDGAMRELRGRIVQGLRARELKLLTAVRSIAVLRRLHLASTDPSSCAEGVPPIPSFDEPELRLAFLASRWDALHSHLTQLSLASGLRSDDDGAKLVLPAFDDPSTNADERVKFVRKWVETWRDVTGEAVATYSEIFLDGVTKPSRPSAPLTSTTSGLRLEDALTPLTSFTGHALTILLRFLSVQTSQLTSVGSLASVLTQLSFCAVAFGKSGHDFRGPVEHLVVSQTGRLVEQRIREAGEGLRKEVKAGMNAAMGGGGVAMWAPRGPKRRSTSYDANLRPISLGVETWLIAPDSLRSVLSFPSSPSSPSSSVAAKRGGDGPDPFITSFPPLARFVNSTCAAFNELRLLASVTLFLPTLTALLSSLTASTDSLLEVSSSIDQPVQSEGTEGEGEEDQEGEKGMKRTRCAIMASALTTWARLVLPVLLDGLKLGVYGEVEEVEDLGRAEVQALVARCEAEVVRLARRPSASSSVGGGQADVASPAGMGGVGMEKQGSTPLPGIVE